MSLNPSTFSRFAIIWLALWFGVIVPGHKRGLVLLPGGDPLPAATVQTDQPRSLARMMAASGTCCPSSSPPASSSSGGLVTHCAVCYLIGVLDVPAAPDLAPRPIELLQILPWPKPLAVAFSPTTHVYLGRAPPTA